MIKLGNNYRNPSIFRDVIGEGVYSLVNLQTTGLKITNKWFHSLVYFKDLLIILKIILWPEDWKNFTEHCLTFATINSSNFDAAWFIFKLTEMFRTDGLNIYSEGQRKQIIMSRRIFSSGNPCLWLAKERFTIIWLLVVLE